MGITLQSAAFADKISHSFFPGPKPFGTIDFGGAMGSNHLYLHGTGEVDEVIAELVALRAEMTGDAAPAGAVAVLAASIADGTPVVIANPPYHMTGNIIGPYCDARDGGYICNTQEGHDGPDHVAYGSDGEQCHRWPVAAEVLAASIADGTPLLVTDDEPEPRACACCNEPVEGDGDICEACPDCAPGRVEHAPAVTA